MANYRYPNLTIINESDLHDANPNFFSNAVIAKVPLPATDAVGHQSIRDAIQQQFQVDIDVQDISKYGVDYFIRAHSSDASARMLARGFANVSTYTLTLMPWTPDYGSTTVPLHTQVSSDPINDHKLTGSTVLSPSERLSIEISGLPPHLCCELAIHHLLKGICTI